MWKHVVVIGATTVVVAILGVPILDALTIKTGVVHDIASQIQENPVHWTMAVMFIKILSMMFMMIFETTGAV
jgi:hypothetical protein